MEPGGFALLDGDASVDSGLGEIHVPRAWRVYLATGLDFREKNRAVCVLFLIKIVLLLGRSEPGFGFSLLPCHFTMKER